MLVNVVLIAVAAILAVAGLSVWIRRSATCARVIETPAGERERIFWGGVLSRYVVTSGTLARFEVFEWGVRISGNVIARWIVPTWEARFDELSRAELVALPHSRIAVWLRLRGQPDAIGFLTDRNSEILAVLERHGVQVNRYVARIRRVAELYQVPD